MSTPIYGTADWYLPEGWRDIAAEAEFVVGPAQDATQGSERVVLGELFLRSTNSQTILGQLRSYMFKGENCAELFRALSTLRRQNRFPDAFRLLGDHVATVMRGEMDFDVGWSLHLLARCVGVADKTLEPIGAHIERVRNAYFVRRFRSQVSLLTEEQYETILELCRDTLSAASLRGTNNVSVA